MGELYACCANAALHAPLFLPRALHQRALCADISEAFVKSWALPIGASSMRADIGRKAAMLQAKYAEFSYELKRMAGASAEQTPT